MVVLSQISTYEKLHITIHTHTHIDKMCSPVNQIAPIWFPDIDIVVQLHKMSLLGEAAGGWKKGSGCCALFLQFSAWVYNYFKIWSFLKNGCYLWSYLLPSSPPQRHLPPGLKVKPCCVSIAPPHPSSSRLWFRNSAAPMASWAVILSCLWSLTLGLLPLKLSVFKLSLSDLRSFIQVLWWLSSGHLLIQPRYEVPASC